MSDKAATGGRYPRTAGQALAIALPYFWLLLFFALPFAIVLKISLAEPVLSQPPYTPLIRHLADGSWEFAVSWANYALLFSDELYVAAFLNSLKIAGISTAICLLLGYPMAYAIARAPAGRRALLLMLVVLPFWTSFLIRIYAWMGILGTTGLLNNFLLALGAIDEPLALMNTDWAIYIGIVYSYLPFMVLPLYATLSRMDLTLLEAAADLGAPPRRAFLHITLPLSLPGIVAGSLLVFIPATGEFVIPDLLGGPDALMIGKVLWTEFFTNHDWPMASAMATGLLILLVGPLVALQMARERQSGEEENSAS